jgi:hypothetical protein
VNIYECFYTIGYIYTGYRGSLQIDQYIYIYIHKYVNIYIHRSDGNQRVVFNNILPINDNSLGMFDCSSTMFDDRSMSRNQVEEYLRISDESSALSELTGSGLTGSGLTGSGLIWSGLTGSGLTGSGLAGVY